MKTEKIDPNNIDYSYVASFIPEVMNAMYNEAIAKQTNLYEIRDAFRVKQMQSKAWLMSHIKHSNLNLNSKVLVIGSWLGFTSLILFKLGFTNITEVDPDVRLTEFAKHLNRSNKNFLHITDDVNNIDLSPYQIVINTSCEHILEHRWFENIKQGTQLFLHSNDLQGYDHINTCSNLDSMILKYPIDLDYTGELNFINWRRFMLVGRKL
jgi:protein-L-isoaspartate O-methyltransferase